MAKERSLLAMEMGAGLQNGENSLDGHRNRQQKHPVFHGSFLPVLNVELKIYARRVS